MDKEIAIKVENLSKTFRIPHEKISTLRGAFVNLPRRLLSKAGAFGPKNYEEFKALDACPVKFGAIANYLTGDVSFEVKKGEFFGRDTKMNLYCHCNVWYDIL